MKSMNLHKYIPGFFIFISLFGVLNYFMNFSLPLVQLTYLTTAVYFCIAVSIRFRQRTFQLFAVLIALILGILALDFAVSSYHALHQGNMIVEEAGTEIPIAQKDSKRHDVKWLHEVRDWLDQDKAIAYAEWVINERIEKGLLNSETYRNNELYERLFASSFALVLAFLLMFIYNRRQLRSLLMLPLAGFIVSWYQFIDYHWTIYLAYFGGLFAYWIMDRQEWLQTLYKDHNRRFYSKAKLAAWSALLAMLFLILSNVVFLLTPYKQINTLADAVVPNIWGARSGYDTEGMRMYSLKDTSLQFEEDRLGGPAGPIDEETALFWVELDNAPTKQLYLKSVIRETYDGTKWLNGTQVYRNTFKFYNENPEHQALLKSSEHPRIKGNIRMDQLNTITLFAPMGLYKTSLDPERVYASPENEAFFKSGAFVKHLKSYDFEATGRDFNIDPDVDYLKVSSWVEDRTKTLALKIGELGETPYEKMTLLTQFLVQNYKYELVTKTPRKTKDFVGTFLFEDKEGYCTYFASALSIMARINGIPSRYVEGFLVTTPQVGIPIKITEAQAHAWTEAYIDGYGWVIFEATPPFTLGSEPVENFTMEEVLSEEAAEATENVASQITSQSREPFEDEEFLMESDGGIDRSETEVATSENSNKAFGLKAIGYTLALLLMSILIFIFYKPINHLRDLPTITHVTRNLQWLCLLIMGNNKSTVFDPEKQFEKANIPPEDARIWLRFLYGPTKSYDKEELVQLQQQISRHIKIQRSLYFGRVGRLKYFRLRVFDIRRMVP